MIMIRMNLSYSSSNKEIAVSATAEDINDTIHVICDYTQS